MAANYWASTQYARWLLTREEIDIRRRKNLVDPSDYDMERIIRPQLIAYTQALGKKLRFLTRVTATASMYVLRFYTSTRMREADPRILVPSALYLAAKVEEMGQFKPEQIIDRAKTITEAPDSPFAQFAYPVWTSQLLFASELLILEKLGFDLVIFLPYFELEKYCADADVTNVTAMAGTLIIDSQRCDVGLMYPPFIIALAALYLACVYSKAEIKPWFDQLNINISEVRACAKDMLDNYDDHQEEARKEKTALALSTLFK